MWPDNKKSKAAAAELEEIHVIVNAVHLDPTTELIERSTTLTQLLKETREPQVGEREEDPFKTALRKCVENVQVRNYHQEIAALTANHPIPRSSSLIKLSPFIGKDGLLRVGGRLEFAALNYDAKHPMILPHNEKLTRLLAPFWGASCYKK